MSVIIANSSPIIGLSKISRLSLLKDLWSEIIIPEAVYREVVIKGKNKPGVKTIKDSCESWIKTVPVKNKAEVRALRAILDEGEAEVIALAQELRANLMLIDNREPRIFAQNLGFRFIGTVGIIQLAWQKGLIIDPLQEIYKLRLNSFWLSDKLIEEIKKEIQEQLKDL